MKVPMHSHSIHSVCFTVRSGRFHSRLLIVVIGLLTAFSAPGRGAQRLRIDEQDSIVFIGNTFAERMHLFGYFETFLHSKFPDYRLKVRNMGWSADEVALRPRPSGFGDLHRYLKQEKADLIFACFGMNESFKGGAGLSRFQRDLDALINDLKAHQYNGHSAPRIVIVSPIAHENLGRWRGGWRRAMH